MDIYLVTGGAGFIGSNFIKYMLEKNDPIRIICLDKLTYAGNIANIENELRNNKGQLKFIKGDICNPELVEYIFDHYHIKYVVNFAAESHVDRSIKDADIFLKTNILGVQNLLKIARKKWEIEERTYDENVRFLQVSTDEVYGSLEGKELFKEDDPLKPNNPYSASKAGAEMLVRSYCRTYNFPGLITRCSNNYGPYQFPEKFIPLMINNILKGISLPVYGDGKNIRDWLYVEDHCQAIDLVLKKGTPKEIYNIGGNNEVTNIELVEILIREIKILLKNDETYKKVIKTNINKINNELITFIKDRPGHDKRYGVDTTKIRNEIGWEPTTSFNEGILTSIKWYLNNQWWLKSVTSGDYQNYYKKMYSTS